MLLHVSTLRSSSGRIHCSLLKLYVKMLITLLYLSVMGQHIVCMRICCIPCREVGRLQQEDHIFRAISLPCSWTVTEICLPKNVVFLLFHVLHLFNLTSSCYPNRPWAHSHRKAISCHVTYVETEEIFNETSTSFSVLINVFLSLLC